MTPPSSQSHESGDAHSRRPLDAALVIEDDPMVREVLAASFTLLGFSVHTVDQIENALPLVESGAYDLIVLDRVMPGIGGTRGVVKIREALAGRPCMIVGVSGNASNDVVEEWKRCGIDVFIEKPLHLSTLRRLVESSRGLPLAKAPGTPVATPLPLVLDPEVRQEVESLGRRTGKPLFEPLWRALIESIPTHLSRIDLALESGDVDGVVRMAHGLRGVARTVGALDLAAACGAIEDEIARSDASQRSALRAGLDSAVARVKALRLD